MHPGNHPGIRGGEAVRIDTAEGEAPVVVVEQVLAVVEVAVLDVSPVELQKQQQQKHCQLIAWPVVPMGQMV